MPGAPMPGQPMPGQPMPGMPMAGMPGMPMPGPPNPNQEMPADPMGDEDKEVAGDTLVGGERPQGGTTDIESLARLERGRVRQTYERQLPPEYRAMAQEYFEVLATPEE